MGALRALAGALAGMKRALGALGLTAALALAAAGALHSGRALSQITPYGPTLGQDGTASAPSYSFISAPGNGLNHVAGSGNTIDLVAASTALFRIDGAVSSSTKIPSTWSLGWATSVDITTPTAPDVRLFRDAAGTLALRDGANAQTFRIYNTFTDASNYERGFVRWNASVFEIGNENAGTGQGRNVLLRSGGASIRFNASSGGGDQWAFSAGQGTLVTIADNAVDIGSFGANRPRNVYLGSTIYTTAPNTQTGATYTVATTDNTIIANRAGTITMTLPAVASSTGRKLRFVTIQAQTVVSAASNVVPLAGGAAGTAILAATAGKWADLECDGSNWIITASN